MSYEEEDTCRLCATDQNLISLYSGKARNLRGFIREMIEELVPIEIQWDDASICFNCSVDVSSFYVFKQDILQKHKHLENLQSPDSKAKRLKLDSPDLKVSDRPSIDEAETVISWLESKRAKLQSKVQKETGIIAIKCDIATQCEVVETLLKGRQTSSLELVNSASQCDEIYPPPPPKASVKSKPSSNEKKSEYAACSKSNCDISKKKESKNRYTQTKTSLYEKSSQPDNEVVRQSGNKSKPDIVKNFKDSYCQTKTIKFADNCSQTKQRRLTQNLFNNSVGTEVYTKDMSIQTNKCNSVNRRIQCDVLKLNGLKNSVLQSKLKISSKEGKRDHKIADPQTFANALLNGVDNTFVSSATQTDRAVNPCDLCNFSGNYLNFTTKESYLPTSIKNPEDKLKINISFNDKFKEEKLSPSETLTISTKSPENIGLSPHRSPDLLLVNRSKTEEVKICKICDKSLYNKTEVVIHKKTHMQCKICRRKFKSLKATQAHVIDCKVKLISIKLVRIDQESEEIREKFFKIH